MGWKPGEKSSEYRRLLEKAVGFIEEHISEPVSLEQVAQAASLSPFHFHRIFSAVMGETLNSYVNRVRLERAANYLIKNPAMTVTEAATACGFTSSASFARSFKQYFSIPASQYRHLKLEEYQRNFTSRVPVEGLSRAEMLRGLIDLRLKLRTPPVFYGHARDGYVPVD